MSKGQDKNNQKIIVVTGASSGIGKSTAVMLAREGHQIIATSRHKKNLDSLIDESRSFGGCIVPEELNINKSDEVERCFERLFANFGEIDDHLTCLVTPKKEVYARPQDFTFALSGFEDSFVLFSSPLIFCIFGTVEEWK